MPVSEQQQDRTGGEIPDFPRERRCFVNQPGIAPLSTMMCPFFYDSGHLSTCQAKDERKHEQSLFSIRIGTHLNWSGEQENKKEETNPKKLLVVSNASIICGTIEVVFTGNRYIWGNPVEHVKTRFFRRKE